MRKKIKWLFRKKKLKAPRVVCSPVFITLFSTLCSFLLSFVAVNQFSSINQGFQVEMQYQSRDQLVTRLIDDFSCKGFPTISFCYAVGPFFLGTEIAIELAIIAWLTKRRGKRRKIRLVGGFLLQQLLLVVPIIGPGAAFSASVWRQERVAGKQITEAVEVLSAADRRREKGIVNSADEIRETLEQNKDILVNIVEEAPPQHALIVYLWGDLGYGHQGTFFDSIVLPAVAFSPQIDELIKEKVSVNYLFFPSGILSINRLDAELVRAIAELLSQRSLEKCLPEYINEDAPEVEIAYLERDRYLEIRNKQIEERKQEVLAEIELVRKEIGNQVRYIEQTRKGLREVVDEYLRYGEYGRNWIDSCHSDYGNESDFCKEGEKKIESNLADLIDAKQLYKQYLEEAEADLGLGNQYLASLNKQYDQLLKDPGTLELEQGAYLFEPKQIFISLGADQENQELLLGHIHTTIHELLHFYSDTSAKHLPVFFEEGLTEFFAYECLKKQWRWPEGYSFYPDHIQVLEATAQQIPQEVLAKIYFNQDEEALGLALGAYFPDIDLERFFREAALLHSLPYDNDREEAGEARDALIQLLEESK